MTKETRSILIDDLDGSAAHHTITFAYLDRRYEIDLSTDNAEAFFNLITPYIEAGRPARPHNFMEISAPLPSPAEVREWARANGYNVSGQGRIAHRIRAAHAASLRDAQSEAE